jgi:uncharacterized protein YfdQ (DUF2303 family)
MNIRARSDTSRPTTDSGIVKLYNVMKSKNTQLLFCSFHVECKKHDGCTQSVFILRLAIVLRLLLLIRIIIIIIITMFSCRNFVCLSPHTQNWIST